MPEKSSDIVVSGVGIVSPYGIGKDVFLQSIKQGKCARRELTLFEVREGFEFAGEIENLNYQDYIFTTQAYVDRTTAASLIAARTALDDAVVNLCVADKLSPKCGVCYASCCGGIESIERFSAPILAGKPRSAQGLVFVQSFLNSAASVIAIEFNLSGFSTVSGGGRLCAINAFENASDAILSGRADMMLVGAADTLSELYFNHLINNGTLTEERLNNSEYFLGEGACFFVLEKKEIAIARGVTAKADYNVLLSSLDTEKESDGNYTSKYLSLHGDCMSVNPLFAAYLSASSEL